MYLYCIFNIHVLGLDTTFPTYYHVVSTVSMAIKQQKK